MKTVPTRHINLTLPRGWNQCTTAQLEIIAAVIMRHSQQQDRYHPFDWTAVKTELFFLLAGLEAVSTADDNSQYVVRRVGEEPFPILTWQIYSFIDQHLQWLDDEKAQPLVIFPYKTLLCEWRWQRHFPFVAKYYLAPGELLQDFTWAQYRHLQDYMELYVRQQNAAIAMTQQNRVVDTDKLHGLQQTALDARNRFLAILFRCEHRPRLVRRIGQVQWQVILFWWSGFMRYLQQQYPKCFKSSGDKKKHRQPNPLELYVSITATMQKYLSLDEEKVNAQTFHLTLEALDRMAKENEEMEKVSKRHKR